MSVWTLSTITQSIAWLVALRDSQVDTTNLSKELELQWLPTDRVASYLACTRRLEDTELLTKDQSVEELFGIYYYK